MGTGAIKDCKTVATVSVMVVFATINADTNRFDPNLLNNL